MFKGFSNQSDHSDYEMYPDYDEQWDLPHWVYVALGFLGFGLIFVYYIVK